MKNQKVFLTALLSAASFREFQNGLTADVLIRPNLAAISVFKVSKKQEQELFELGYQSALAAFAKTKV